MAFREKLRESLDFCGLEQKELAHKANISLRNIENYLRENASVPSADKAVRIAQVLGVTVEYLVTGTDSPTKSSASILYGIDNDIQQLLKSLKNLSKAKQHIIIKNALNLCEMFK
ncbi:MAG: helix-turn-helix domain-containing protein [Treponema sp.]|nr:helix-turn-helix domain-containing protein [Treponema sp.]